MGEYRARSTDLVVEELDDGLVIYDTRSDQAHWLDTATAAVWRASNHASDETAIVTMSGIDPTTCRSALDQLVTIGLVDAEADDVFSRRTALRGAAKLGVAGAVAAPIVTAIIPAAAAAASTINPGGGPGTNNPPPCTDPCPHGTADTATHNSYHSAVVASSDGGKTWGPTYAYQNPAYGPPISPSEWISVSADGNAGAGDYYYKFPSSIDIPCSAATASLTVQFYSDNQGTVFLNGSQIAQNSACGTAGETADFGAGGAGPTSVTVPLTPGSSNTVLFKVNNCGDGPTALDFVVTSHYACP